MPVQQAPLRVKGTGFVPGERVQVLIGGKRARTIEADASGSFGASFAGFDRCESVTVTAVGSKGSRASFNLAQTLCAAP